MIEAFFLSRPRSLEAGNPGADPRPGAPTVPWHGPEWLLELQPSQPCSSKQKALWEGTGTHLLY